MLPSWRSNFLSMSGSGRLKSARNSGRLTVVDMVGAGKEQCLRDFLRHPEYLCGVSEID
jgi:hypothetical protein